MEVQPDAYFHREGSDIVTEDEISFATASLGGEISVRTIGGNVMLRIPAGTQPNALFRLQGRGVSHVRGTAKGDHYVRIKIVVPKNLSKRQKELLSEFDAESKKKKSWI
jgi:DnaJ-class molecular chaperone